MQTISQLVRFSMAAGMYLLLMWGYMVLPNAQWFAAFLALILSTMLIYWVTETRVTTDLTENPRHAEPRIRSGYGRPGITMADWQEKPDEPIGGDLRTSPPGLEAAVLRLDSLKSELMAQYAQFGRDQSLINGRGLGSWHGKRDFHKPT
ncbi:hypothetical protein ACUNV4_02910 [Granulosicoccus sp. 3-233]|uniref:hypothetical protein n=1 Tax=Granulosicoccus sp. 3-233 TaxID=3417969 RepID=UPI003D32D86E